MSYLTIQLAPSGTPNTESEFYVDTSKAGDGDLNVVIEGPVDVDVTPVVTKLTEHHYKVSGGRQTGDRKETDRRQTGDRQPSIRHIEFSKSILEDKGNGYVNIQ